MLSFTFHELTPRAQDAAIDRYWVDAQKTYPCDPRSPVSSGIRNLQSWQYNEHGERIA